MTDHTAADFMRWHAHMCLRAGTAAAVVLIVAATPIVGPMLAHVLARFA